MSSVPPSPPPQGTSQRKTKFCSNCGAEIDINAEICPKCGVRVAPPPTPVYPTEPPGAKSPGIALILSLLIPGVGQMYNGEIGKGILILLIAIISIPLALVFIGFLTYIAVWIYGMIDAYEGAHRINQKLGVRREF